jgi:hypothetical protein
MLVGMLGRQLGYTPGDPKSVARLNAERIATYNELMEAFERAGARRYGW